MDVALVMFRADGERRSFALTRNVTVIGRREDCDLRIPLTEISRKHCRLIQDGEKLRLEDLGSSNGTYHNGTRIQESEMQAGDQLQIGPVIFTVQINGFPAEEEIQPPAAQEEEPAASAEGVDELATTGQSPIEPTEDQDDMLLDNDEAGEKVDEDDDIIDFGNISEKEQESK